MARIAVIICFRNVAAFLGEALRSLEMQSYKDWRAILLDDGSNDGSGEIAHLFATKYPEKCDLVRRVGDRDKGRGKARMVSDNIGMVREPYITFLDGDDRLEPNALDVAVAAMDANKDVDVLVSGCRKIDAHGASLGGRRWNDEPYSERAVRVGRLSPALMVIRTDAFLDAGALDVAFERAQMYELRLRMAARKPFMVIPEVLYAYRQWDGQVTRDSEKQGEFVRKARSKHRSAT